MRLRTAAAAAVVAGFAATAAAAVPASAAVTQVPSGTVATGNWAGYYAVPANGQGPEAVFATFTVPRVDCGKSIGLIPAYGSMWAGIGGMDDISKGKPAWLEQAGVQITCKTRKSQPLYEPFWEIVRPHDPEKDPYGNPYDSMVFQNEGGHSATVRPGDTIHAAVYDGSYQKVKQFGFRVIVEHPDGSDGADYTKSAYLPPSAYTGRTAEVVTEHPSGPSVLQGDLAWIRLHEFGITKPLPVPGGLVQMGDVHYSAAMYLTHRPGDVKPTGVPVTQSRITLRDNLDNMPFWRVAMTPSAAYPTVPGSSVMDGFFTRYAP